LVAERRFPIEQRDADGRGCDVIGLA